MKAKIPSSASAYDVNKGIMEEGAQDQLKREWILFKQIDRINEAQSVGSPLFVHCVECLEVNLWPEIKKNDEFKAALEKIEADGLKAIKRLRKNDPRIDYDEERSIIFSKVSKNKLKILMEIMDKGKLFPMKKASFHEDDKEN